MNDFQVHLSNSTFFHFHFEFFLTPRGPTAIQASGNESNPADIIYAVLHIGSKYLYRPLEVFDILKIYQNKVESFAPPVSQLLLRQN